MKKTLNILKNIFTWLIVIVAVGMMIFTIVSVMTFDRVDRNILGYRAFIVLSDSMSTSNINAGDLILSKEVDPYTLQPGDIISYQSTNSENYGEVITHKIRSIVDAAETGTGYPGFITYGTTTDTDDEGIVNFSQVLGKHSVTLHGVGTFFQFLKTVPGYIVCILVPFLILIILQGINSIKLFKKYKKEQEAELNEERERIENERKETQEQSKQLMEELAALKKELDEAKKARSDESNTDTDAPSA